jgi:hypothetical protein
MFDVKILCEDKDLPKVLWALDGIAVGMPTATPVRGAKVVTNTTTGMKAAKPALGAGTLSQAVASLLQESGLETITTARMMELTSQCGGSPVSGYGVVSTLVKSKLLKRNGRGTFTVKIGKRKIATNDVSGRAQSNVIARQSGKTLVQRVGDIIQEKQLAELSFSDLGDMAVEAGGAATSSYYIADSLVAEGVLRRGADGDRKGTYIVQDKQSS